VSNIKAKNPKSSNPNRALGFLQFGLQYFMSGYAVSIPDKVLVLILLVIAVYRNSLYNHFYKQTSKFG